MKEILDALVKDGSMDQLKKALNDSEKVNQFKKVDVKKTDELSPEDLCRKMKRIVLPSGMALDEAIHHLEEQRDYEESDTGIHHVIDCFPLDGAYALMHVLEEKYGWAQAIKKQTMFGSSPPTMLSIDVGPGETAQVIWGDFKIPNCL